MVEIDGSHGEGGGQIVRTVCSLAALSGTGCRIINIRELRRKPGLMVQHLLAVRALAQLCNASLSGDSIGSSKLVFEPRKIVSRELAITIPTAGSITLILQALIPAALAAPSPITMRFEGGATDTAMSPTLDYFRSVFLRFLGRMGAHVRVSIARRGYYPRGGAAMSVQVAPARLAAVDAIERGPLRAVRIFSHAAAVLKARQVAERQAAAALEILGSLASAPEVNVDYGASLAAGSAICAVAEFANTVIGADALGAAGKLAERVGQEAAQGLMRELASQACLDRHMADQILPYIALADGDASVTVSEVTDHCRTNMWVIEKFFSGSFGVKDGMDPAPFSNDGLMMGQDGNLDHPQQNNGEGPR
jgi:RNA 3'-phosphate cyclase